MISAQEPSSDHYLPIFDSSKDIREHVCPENILLVDDAPYILCIMDEMLASLGYKVITKINGMEALALFIENPSLFDLVITDLNMPYMNGDELALKLVDIRKDIPVIICSGSSEFTLKELMRWVPIRGYIQKPCGIRLLSATVHKALLDGKNRKFMRENNPSIIEEGRRSRKFS